MLNVTNFLKKHTALLSINLAIVIFFSSLYVYDHIQVKSSIINLEQSIKDEKTSRVCNEAETRLSNKIATMKFNSPIKNIQVSIDIQASYEVALNLAIKKDLRCILMEELGDSMLSSYQAGVKDGTKNFDLGGV